MRRLGVNGMGMLVVLTMMAATVSLSCGGDGKETEPLKLVPAGSSLIAEISLGDILSNDGLTSVFEALPTDNDAPQTVDQLLSEALNETGIDLRDIRLDVVRGRFPA